MESERKHKMVFISDCHLPRKDSHPKKLYEFLENNPSETLVIVGDFLEGFDEKLDGFGEWDLRVLDLIHARIESGMCVVYIPGNHDDYLRMNGLMFHKLGGIEYYPNYIFDDLNGNRVLAFHGDELDKPSTKKMGKMVYRLAKSFGISKDFNLVSAFTYTQVLRDTIMEYLMAFSKEKAKFQRLSSAFGHMNHCTKVITGHIHTPKPFEKVIDGMNVDYANTGGWVGNHATGLVLNNDNQWLLVDWDKERLFRGFSDLPSKNVINPYKAYRRKTVSFIQTHRAFHSLWRQRILNDVAVNEGISDLASNISFMRQKVVEILKKASPLDNRAEDFCPQTHEANCNRQKLGIELIQNVA